MSPAAVHLLRHSLALRDQGEDHVGNDGDLEDITGQDDVGSSQSHFGMLGDCALGTSSPSPSANPVDLRRAGNVNHVLAEGAGQQQDWNRDLVDTEMVDTDQRMDKAATGASEMANGVQEESTSATGLRDGVPIPYGPAPSPNEVSMTSGPEPPHPLRLLVHLPSGL